MEKNNQHFPLVDTHCHLQDVRMASELTLLLAEARSAGIGGFVCCGSGEEDWGRVRELAAVHHDVVAFLGVHPFYVQEQGAGWLDLLGNYLTFHPEFGVGEIGLDGLVSCGNMDEQEMVFTKQLRLARDLRRPVSLHCRKAWDRMLPILKKEGGLLHGGAFHAWSGSPELIREVEKLGAHVGFGASITRSANSKVRRSLLAVSPERLLIETDAPDIPPVFVKEGINRPAYLRHTFSAIAEILGVGEQPLQKQLYRNSLSFLSPLCRVGLTS
ncbi:TatD family hydrolase [Desulfobotulus sp. H1]|uniref:TatD family hydrolase n=1 Tax=Desulfobotulus pelophilus TaxID=2823377 RepID=A0ABT3NAR5_9BACT|nr:TatD family hydrolase [Desulfobotulus pelophilus]MCW7754550.1 TatD family hydrolase [Desulfobotulus pelophilus]